MTKGTLLPGRQINLDFHTSPCIENIGVDFDAEAFADQLVRAHVDSITLFARDHQGYLFYPSKRFPNLLHPHLVRPNLLIEQIDACHARGIRTPIYTTIGWDGRAALEHPEWLARDPHGEPISGQPNEPKPNFYDSLCLNSGYRSFVLAHLNDLIDTLGPERIDGLFLDIFFLVPCDCERCRVQMERHGFDHTDIRQRERYNAQLADEFRREVRTLIDRRVPGASLFFNGSHIGPANRSSLATFTHLEIESLPGGVWGYDNFPIVMRYVRNLGKPVVGMTGKFHTYWGDFHSLKAAPALEYECFQMISLGAGCSIGDQLHPSGKLSEAAYDLIGSVYGQVEALEDVTRGSESMTDIAVMTPEREWTMDSTLSDALIGANRMLTELGCQFDIIDSDMDFGRYRLIVLPDEIKATPDLLAKLEAFVADGGTLLGTYHSLDLGDDTVHPLYGHRMLGESYWDRDFIMPNEAICRTLPREEFVMYERGARVMPVEAETLMDSVEPWFNREGHFFCSHQHAPSTGRMGFPAVTRHGGVVYCSHPLFTIYRDFAPAWVKAMVNDILDLLVPYRLVRKVGERTISGLELQLRRAPGGGALLLHCLWYPVKKQASRLFTIDERVALHNQRVRVRIGDVSIRGVMAVRAGIAVPATDWYVEDGWLDVTIPVIDGYEIIRMDLA